MNEILQLKITLYETKPVIWRRLQVHQDMTFFELHIAIQIAMGWTNSHLFEFSVNKTTLCLPNEEGAFDEEGDEEGFKTIDATHATLQQFLNKPNQKFSYLYDFGDCWEHTVEVEKIVAQETWFTYPMCMDGEMNCPPEDSGGVEGFYEKLKILEDKNHPEYKEVSTWLGKKYNPELFISEKANEELRKMDKWLERMFE